MDNEMLDNMMNENELLNEYITFTTTSRSGEEIELAVVDEFEVDDKLYVAAALIKDDEINADEVFLYRAKIAKEDNDEAFVAEKIVDMDEYNKVSKAYLELE